MKYGLHLQNKNYLYIQNIHTRICVCNQQWNGEKYKHWYTVSHKYKLNLLFQKHN